MNNISSVTTHFLTWLIRKPCRHHEYQCHILCVYMYIQSIVCIVTQYYTNMKSTCKVYNLRAVKYHNGDGTVTYMYMYLCMAQLNTVLSGVWVMIASFPGTQGLGTRLGQ